MNKENITDLAAQVGQVLRANQQTVTTAESCTGGGISYFLTEVAGSSTWFDCAFVTYSNHAKHEMLAVCPLLIEQDGAVSESVALAMATGAKKAANASIAVAVSGIAGPSGGTAEKPVGTVCFAWVSATQSLSQTHCFAGDRASVRLQTIAFALRGILRLFDEHEFYGNPYL